MQNKFCYLKGIVDCDSGTIQDCNNKRTVFCPLEQEKTQEKKPEGAGARLRTAWMEKRKNQEKRKAADKIQNGQGFCFLKGMVSCNPGIIQDCNIKRVSVCPTD